MARPIKDTIVLKKCEELNFDTIYLDNVPAYSGNVIETINKTRFESSEFGIQKEAVTKSLRDKYESIQIKDDDCFVEVQGMMKVPATKEQIRCLKALAIEQISYVQEYSDVVSQLFMELFQQIFSRNVTCVFKKRDDFTKLQEVIFDEYQVFLQKKILGRVVELPVIEDNVVIDS